MRLKRVAIIVCVAFVAAIAAIAIAIHYLDPRSVVTRLALSVKAETGRELDFGGVDVKLLPRPAIDLSEVRFANAAWGTRPWLAQVGRVTIDIDVPTLFTGRLRAKHITMSDASVFIETDADGKGNWVMGAAAADTPAWLKSIEVDEFKLQGLALAYRDGETGKAISVRLDSALITAPSASRPIHLSVHGTFDGRSVAAAGTIGDLTALISNAPSYPVDLEGKVGEASVSIRGTVGKPSELDALNLRLRVQASELAELAGLFGANVPPLGPVHGAAQLTGTATAPGLSAIDITIGGKETPEIRLNGAVADLRAVRGIDVTLAAAATDWWRFNAGEGPRLPPFHASARVRDAQQGYRVDDLRVKIADSTVDASLQIIQIGTRFRVTGKVESPLIDLTRLSPRSGSFKASPAGPGTRRSSALWKFADADLDLSVGRLIFPNGHNAQSGSGRFVLDNGRLKVHELQATLGGAKVRLDGSIAEPQTLAGLDLKLALQGSELAELFKFFGTPIPSVGPYHGRAQMHGSLDVLRLTAINATAGPPGQRLRATGRIDDTLHWQGVQLALIANVSDSIAAGRLFGIDLPRLPSLHATARFTGPQGGYVFNDLSLDMGRTSMQGRVVYMPGTPRPRVTAKLSGSRLDLSELPSLAAKSDGTTPLLAADVETDIHFDQVVLPNRRALGPVSGEAKLMAGAVELHQFTVAVDGASMTVDGRIGDPMKPAALELMVNAKFKYKAGLAAFIGRSLPDLPAFTASGRLTDVPNGYAISDLTLDSAAATISGDVAVTRGAQRYKISAKAHSPLLDLSAYTRPAAAGSATKPVPAGTRAIPDLPLPVERLNAIDADLDLRIDEVRFGDAPPLGPLLVKAVIVDGRLKADPVRLTIQAGQVLSATGTIDAAQAAWALRIEGTGLDLGEMLTRFGRPRQVTGGSTDLEMQFQANGTSLSSVLGSMNGLTRIKAGPFRVQNFGTNLGAGILMQMTDLVNPFRKTDPFTDAKCFAARVPIKDGLIISNRNVAVETTKYNAVLSGTVNLRTEDIDIAVTPIVTHGVGIGAGEITRVVRLRGTIANPSLGVDPVDVAKSAVSVGAAWMTLGASWIADALIKRAIADPHPCATALGKALEQ